ncbi:hypothetical protein DTO021C3_5712 [Paecilomyces variotii]|nr:hypothetical protein DTO021C3_5712 [Paecilomyces variotii]
MREKVRIRYFIAGVSQSLIGLFSHWLYHSYSIWLFTFSDLKTILIPSTIFGIANSLAATSYGLPSLSLPPTLKSKLFYILLQQTPAVLVWVWINLLPFTINNQRDISAIAEDSVNKPWRPLPSKRMTSGQAKYTMLVFYAAAQTYSLLFSGGLRQSLGLLVLGTWYNNMGGADSNPLVRNLINALGYLCFISGALEVALGGGPLHFYSSQRLLLWLLVVAGIIISTVHTQDIYDQEGDAERGRRTVPLVIGDRAARWSIAVPMLVWGLFCPIFWNVHVIFASVSCALAWAVAARTLLFRNVRSDKRTFIIWNLWITTVYVMPLCARVA